jgi:hypothetical protein
MKFEKHLKNTGIYGVVCTAYNGDKYLRTGKNGHVLARVPAGFAPVGQAVTHDLEGWINDILINGAEELREAKLFAAKLEKDGKAKDIRRVWAGDNRIGDDGFDQRRCEIDNAAFGLIERGDDVRIFDPSIDCNPLDDDDLEPIDEPVEAKDAETITPALVILDRDETVVGIILEPWWEN